MIWLHDPKVAAIGYLRDRLNWSTNLHFAHFCRLFIGPNNSLAVLFSIDMSLLIEPVFNVNVFLVCLIASAAAATTADGVLSDHLFGRIFFYISYCWLPWHMAPFLNFGLGSTHIAA